MKKSNYKDIEIHQSYILQSEEKGNNQTSVKDLYKFINDSSSNNKFNKTQIQQIFETIFDFNKKILFYPENKQEKQDSLEIFQEFNSFISKTPMFFEDLNYSNAEDYIKQQITALVFVKCLSNNPKYFSAIKKTINECLTSLFKNNNITLILEIIYSLHYKLNTGSVKSEIKANLNELIKKKELVNLIDILQNYHFRISNMKDRNDLYLVEDMFIVLVQKWKKGLEKYIDQMSIFYDRSFRSFINENLKQFNIKVDNKSQNISGDELIEE